MIAYLPAHATHRHRRCRRARGLTEFNLAIFVFFFMALFPMMNLAMLVGCYAIVCLFDEQEVTRAAAQQNYSDALSAMYDEANGLNQSGFARCAQLAPAGGFKGSGFDLYVDATDFLTGKTTSFGPNTPVPPPVDQTKSIYQYRVESNHEIKPLVNLSGVPILGTVPGLGVPAKVHWSAHRLCEHAEGLAASSKGTVFSGGTSQVNLSLNGLETPGSLTDFTNSNWNNPNIYDMIKAAGEQVVAEEVLLVNADDPNWTVTTLSISSGDKVWIDYQANGAWTYCPGGPMSDANGTPAPAGSGGTGTPWNYCAMLGQVGSVGPFYLGNKQWNFPPPGTGTLSLICNDGYWSGSYHGNLTAYNDNSGVMTVRVIIAR